MTIFDVVVNTDDIVVLGPPENIDLSVSVGEKGDRGATFFAGSGNPNLSQVSENIFGNNITPIAGDIYINTAVGPEYGWLYVYNPKISGNQWDQILRISPTIFAKNAQAVFINGQATISIPLTDILPSGVIQTNADNFITIVTAIGSDPAIFSISSKTISSGNLNIVLSSARYDLQSESWAKTIGTQNLSIHIIVI